MMELNEEFYEILKEKIQPYFEGIDPCHDFSHTQRVYNLALQLASHFKDINLDVVKLSSLLHDVARKEEFGSKGKVCHAERGAEIAKKVLEELEIEREIIKQVIYCIKTHRFRKGNIPESKEAMILYDADKLDGIGGIGVLRSSSFAGSIGAVVHNMDIEPKDENCYTKEDSAYHEFLFKLLKIKDKMLTEQGKRIAEKRHEFMKDFFERVNKEVRGEI
jgi:uncharacterized protein